MIGFAVRFDGFEVAVIPLLCLASYLVGLATRR